MGDSNHGRRRSREDQRGAGREEGTNEDNPSEAYRNYRDDDPEDEGSEDGGDPRDTSRGSRRSGSARSELQVLMNFRLKVINLVNYFSTPWELDEEAVRSAYCKQVEQCF